MADDKHWAKEYILDPLNGPNPSEETGPGTHFRSTFAPITPSPPPEGGSPSLQRKHHTGGSASTNPFRRSTGSSSSASRTYPTPPASASPRKEKFPASYREQAFASENTHPSPSKSSPNQQSGHRRRASSLTERYPGDTSTEPLAMLRKASTRAHRSPHLRKANHHGTDAIDRLDPTSNYHHESPYDAVSVARNRQTKYSPIAALKSSNAEALKATPRENVEDSIAKHRPLEGTAVVPPGMVDRMGRRYSYEEGTDLMRENGGNYKRWPGVEYHPSDLKGKGEPSYSIERALKEHKSYGGDAGIEMKSRSRNKSLGHRERPSQQEAYAADSEIGVGRRNTTGRRGLKQRLLGRRE